MSGMVDIVTNTVKEKLVESESESKIYLVVRKKKTANNTHALTVYDRFCCKHEQKPWCISVRTKEVETCQENLRYSLNMVATLAR